MQELVRGCEEWDYKFDEAAQKWVDLILEVDEVQIDFLLLFYCKPTAPALSSIAFFFTIRSSLTH